MTFLCRVVTGVAVAVGDVVVVVVALMIGSVTAVTRAPVVVGEVIISVEVSVCVPVVEVTLIEV